MVGRETLKRWLRRGSMYALCGCACLLAGTVHEATAQDGKMVSQRGYHLLNPVPDSQLRELSTDRPDKTESPYTVDAGRFQIEMDVFNYAHDKTRQTRLDRYSVATTNVKVGLLPNLDFQMVLETYTHERTKDRLTGAVQRRSGFGDVTLRAKLNLWGNDGGPTALAVMPFVKFPTNQDNLGNDAVEGGFIFPLAVELPWGWRMGVQTEFDISRDADERGYHPEFINSITFGHDIIGNLGGYVEFFSLVSTDNASPWIGTVDLGLTYQLTKHIQLDAGVNIGVTGAADDVNPFVGTSFRF